MVVWLDSQIYYLKTQGLIDFRMDIVINIDTRSIAFLYSLSVMSVIDKIHIIIILVLFLLTGGRVYPESENHFDRICTTLDRICLHSEISWEVYIWCWLNSTKDGWKESFWFLHKSAIYPYWLWFWRLWLINTYIFIIAICE